MKSHLLKVLFFLITLQLSSQNITGKVIESENNIQLSEVKIINTNDKDSTLSTNFNGLFSLPEKGTYTFSKEGFLSKTITISDNQFIIVKLELVLENLNEVVITSNNLQSQLKTFSSAISIIGAKEIENNDNVNITSILNTVPGVYMNNGTLTTNKITIRGIGSRNLYGTSKIRAYFQDIPLTNGSGESTIEDVEIAALGRIEILKGPSSSIYGAGLGGTIQLIPNKGTFDENSLKLSTTLGSFGLQKHVAQINLGNQTNSANIVYSDTQKEGFRENNQFDKKTLTVATNHFLGNADKLTFIANYIDIKSFIPSSINEDDFLNAPTSAAFTWKKAKGNEDYTKGLFGISWQHDYSTNTTQHTSVFHSFLDSYESKSFEYEGLKNNSIGARTRIISNTELFKKPLQWTVGGELFRDYNNSEKFLIDSDVDDNNIEGNLKSNLKEKRTYFNIFLDSKLELTNSTTFSLGLNLNKTSYNLEDKFTPGSAGLSGDYSFDAILSPKIGLTHQLSNNVMIYESISHGFSPPTLAETLLPDSTINPNIKPESGWNFEIGSRGQIFNNKLNYTVAIYKMDIKNLLVPRRTGDEEFVGINAGKTQYNGLELSFGYHIIKSEKVLLYHSHTLNINDYTFKDFVDEENNADFSGNKLTGMPKSTYNSRLNLESKFGIYGFVNYNYVGKIPMRDDNSIYSKKYQLVNTRVGYKSSKDKKLQFNVFVGINNLFDEGYASMILINAPSFGGNPPRYYYPGEPTNYYTGASLKYVF